MKIKWNSERLLSLTAMGMSFLTLVIFIWQTNLLSRQNYLSILPYLQLSTSDDPHSHSFELRFKNHGVGPAILESVTMEYRGTRFNLRDYNDQIMELLANFNPELDSIHFTYSTLNNGIAIPANSTYSFLTIENSPKDYNLITKALTELQEKGLKYEIVYRSLLNERWLLQNDSAGPVKLD